MLICGATVSSLIYLFTISGGGGGQFLAAGQTVVRNLWRPCSIWLSLSARISMSVGRSVGRREAASELT